MTRQLFVPLTFICSLLLAAMLISSGNARAAFEASNLVQEAQEKFDPEGSFFPKGAPPKGLENVGGINLFKRPKKTYDAEGAGVALTNGRTYRFKTLTVSREKLVFTTVAINGISYSFEGRFLKDGVFATMELDNDAVVLEGRLTKFRRGEKIAEADMKFTYFGGT
jgi:hypothetical protein